MISFRYITSHSLASSMSEETTQNAVNNSNIVDLLSTLNPAAATASTTTLTPSSGTIRNDDMNVDSSDFVPANRLLTQRQAMNTNKQRMLKFSCVVFFNLSIYLVELLREQQRQLQTMEVDDQQAFEVSFTKHR